jgi:hypothetical protein
MRRSAILAAAVALLVLGGVAYAAIPDANGVIHGCRKNSGGALRVIDSEAGQTCSGSETALNWNQTGPAGISGWQRVFSSTMTIAAGQNQTVTATCPTGKTALSGGYDTNDASGSVIVYVDLAGADSYTAGFKNNGTESAQVYVVANCAVVAA